MNYKNKNNKTVIRTDRVAGKFTTIPHRIIHDKRLSSNARLLLISILSDADKFDFSRTGLRKRLGFTEYKLDASIKELLNHGYLKKTNKYGQYNHYTISEYGNMNNEIEDSTEVINVEDSEQHKHDFEQLSKYLTERHLYVNMQLIEEANIQNKNDVFELKQIQDKEIKKNKAKHYRLIENFINNGNASKELKPKILKEIKRLITDEHKKPSTDEANKIWMRVSQNKHINKAKKYGFDWETQEVDRYENPLD